MLEDLIPFVRRKRGDADPQARIQPPRANGAKIFILLMEEEFGANDDEKMLEDLSPFIGCKHGNEDL